MWNSKKGQKLRNFVEQSSTFYSFYRFFSTNSDLRIGMDGIQIGTLHFTFFVSSNLALQIGMSGDLKNRNFHVEYVEIDSRKHTISQCGTTLCHITLNFQCTNKLGDRCVITNSDLRIGMPSRYQKICLTKKRRVFHVGICRNRYPKNIQFQRLDILVNPF